MFYTAQGTPIGQLAVYDKGGARQKIAFGGLNSGYAAISAPSYASCAISESDRQALKSFGVRGVAVNGIASDF
jgi:hypothetical protein